MRRLSLWLRTHPAIGDSVIAVLLAGLEVLNARSLGLAPPYLFGYTVTGVLFVAPLIVRRITPVAASWGTLTALLIHTILQTDLQVRPGYLALPILLYTLVVYTGRRAAALHATAAMALWITSTLWHAPDPRPLLPLVLFVAQFALQLAFCWMLGEFVGARRAYLAEVEQRVRRLEFEQDQQARIAVAEERNRIARELHDVLAHSVSVMVTQADGAAYAVRAKPELAEQAVSTISTTGRQTLTELRSLLHVLRNPDDDGTDRAPQPGASGVRHLVARVTELGLPVTLDLTGDVDDLAPGIGLATYRIVQESLTNVLKHAGWKATAKVAVDNDGERVHIEVTDNGARGVLQPLAEGGNGVIGMRERASVYGGTLVAGPHSDGGWQVTATLPLSPPDTDTGPRIG